MTASDEPQQLLGRQQSGEEEWSGRRSGTDAVAVMAVSEGGVSDDEAR